MCVSSCKYCRDESCTIVGNTVPYDALCRIGQKDVEHFIEETGDRENEKDYTLFQFGLRSVNRTVCTQSTVPNVSARPKHEHTNLR